MISDLYTNQCSRSMLWLTRSFTRSNFVWVLMRSINSDIETSSLFASDSVIWEGFYTQIGIYLPTISMSWSSSSIWSTNHSLPSIWQLESLWQVCLSTILTSQAKNSQAICGQSRKLKPHKSKPSHFTLLQGQLWFWSLNISRICN